MKALILAVSKGKFFVLSMLVICLFVLRTIPCPSLHLFLRQQTTFPRLPCSGFWMGPTNKRGNIRGLGVRREALILPSFLHLLCGSTWRISQPMASWSQLWITPSLASLAPATQHPYPSPGNTTPLHCFSWSLKMAISCCSHF